MYKVGIIGHRAGTFHLGPDILKSRINSVLEVLKFQYGKELVLNVDGECGTGLDCIDLAHNLNIKHVINLVAPNEYDTDEEKHRISGMLEKAYSITINSSVYSEKSQSDRDQKMIEDSNFIIVFWEGKHQGRTFELIKYALGKNKIVLNGLDDLKLITNIDIKKRKTK